MRALYAEGKATRDELLTSEMKSYHGPGTCTFYGTANSNQMLMEFMGLHLPGASFINPNTPLREALTRAGTKRALEITALGNEYTPTAQVLDERAFVNGIVGLVDEGRTFGSTHKRMMSGAWPPPAPSVWYVWMVRPRNAAMVSSTKPASFSVSVWIATCTSNSSATARH